VPWRDCAFCLPHRTVARLKADGIALQLQIGFENDPPKWMRPMEWPPRIHGVASPFEGLPPRIGVFQAYGFVHGYATSLFVFFGRPTPSQAQLRAARKELETVRFPASRSPLARPPYVGLACRAPCTRVGIAVWLRQPALGVTARLAGQPRQLHGGGLGGKGPRYWEGYVHLPNLRVPRGWNGTHPSVRLTLRLAIRHKSGKTVETVRVQLHSGWG
jgi:hypothetical protein